MALGEEMIGRTASYDGKDGVVMAVRPAKLVNVETGVERAAVQFKIKPASGRAFWTCALAPA